MKLGTFEYQPHFWSSLGAVLMVALALAASNWQFGRAAEKQALQDRYDKAQTLPPHLLRGDESAELTRYRRVRALGEWVPQRAIWLDNRIYKGLAGYHLLMPLKLAGTNTHVLVNRGWAPRSADLALLAEAPVGMVEAKGLAVVPSGKFIELSNETIAGNVWQNLSLDRYRRVSGMSVMPVVIEQDSHASDGLIREWTRPDAGVQKHIGYAVQWLCIAAVVLVLYVALNIKRRAG